MTRDYLFIFTILSRSRKASSSALSRPPPPPASSPTTPALALSRKMASLKKRKRCHVEIRSGIPLQGDDAVTRVEVARKTRRGVRIKSSQVSVPVINLPRSEDVPDPVLPTPDDPSSRTKKGQKGASRSVAVCFDLSSSLTLHALTLGHIV